MNIYVQKPEANGVRPQQNKDDASALDMLAHLRLLQQWGDDVLSLVCYTHMDKEDHPGQQYLLVTNFAGAYMGVWYSDLDSLMDCLPDQLKVIQIHLQCKSDDVTSPISSTDS